MRPHQRGLSIAAIGIAILGASFAIASIDSSAHLKRLNMTHLSPRLQHIFAKTKTVCFGRFVIDVPATATVVFGRMTVNYEIDRYPGEAGMADKHIAERLAKIDKDEFINRRMNKPDSLYRKVLDGSVAGQKTVVGADGGSYDIYSYAPVGGDLFLFETSSNSLETKIIKQEIAALESVARRLRSRADDEVPSEPGICLDGGFINMNPEFENISMGVRLAEFPDVHLSISTLKNGQYVREYAQLENRLKDAENEARQEGHAGLYNSIKFFRRAPRKIGDWDGQEALARMPAEKDKSLSHQFLFYTVGAKNDIMRPVADIQLDTGVDGNETGAKPPSLSDEEAVALWDKLTGSIRPRPTGPTAKTSDSGPPPLGTHASAGQACPQGGWWDCGDERGGIETLGGRRQYFRPGERMPQAVLFRSPTLWQKLKREQPTFQSGIASIWKLIAYDQSTLDKIAATSAAATSASPPASAASDAPDAGGA